MAVGRKKIEEISPEFRVKSGLVPASSFSGNPLTASITFDVPYADNNYVVLLSGEDKRAWSSESRTASGFIINTNAIKPLNGFVYWETAREWG